MLQPQMYMLPINIGGEEAGPGIQVLQHGCIAF